MRGILFVFDNSVLCNTLVALSLPESTVVLTEIKLPGLFEICPSLAPLGMGADSYWVFWLFWEEVPEVLWNVGTLSTEFVIFDQQAEAKWLNLPH